MDQIGEIFSPIETNGNSTDRFFCRLISRSRSKRASSTPKSSYIDISVVKQKQFLMQKVRNPSVIKNYDSNVQFSQRINKHKRTPKPTPIRVRSLKIPHEYFFFRAVDPFLNSKKLKFSNSTSNKTKLQESVKQSQRSSLLGFLRQNTQYSLPAKSQEKLELNIIVT